MRIAQIAALPGTVAPASYRARETVVRNGAKGYSAGAMKSRSSDPRSLSCRATMCPHTSVMTIHINGETDG